MFAFIKKYWDIITGIAAGLGLAIIVEFELESLQRCYSVIILILVTIGVLRIVKQAVEKNKKRKERKPTIIDDMVDKQKCVQAVSLAQEPTKIGEKMGNLIITLWEVAKKVMKKIKEFLDKFKGYILTFALMALTIIEMCGGFINDLCGGVLTVNGVELLPVITLALTVIVGLLSNTYSTEQMAQIKALFSKSTTNELVKEEIKKTIKEKSAQVTQFNKVLANKQHELANYESELETLNNTHEAKKEMFEMIPQLATAEDVQIAANKVVDCQAKIAEKTKEIEETQVSIKNLTTAINALKSQL